MKKGHRGMVGAASGFLKEILFLSPSVLQGYDLLPSSWIWPWKQHFLAELQVAAVTVRLAKGTSDSLGCGMGVRSPWRLLSPSKEDPECQVLTAGPQNTENTKSMRPGLRRPELEARLPCPGCVCVQFMAPNFLTSCHKVGTRRWPILRNCSSS